MRGNSHVRFLGEAVAATPQPYPTISGLTLNFQCSVLRTHVLGECRRDHDLGEPVVGTVHMYSMLHKGLNRHVPCMTLEGLAKFGAKLPSPIPDLLDPQLLTFSSDRGMMVVGFEEIAGCKYYQGWWMQWIDS